MRKRLLIALFVIAGLVGYAVTAKHFRIFPFYQLKVAKLHLMPAHDTHYYQRLKGFSDCQSCDYDIVMIGDSLTEHADWKRLLPFWKIANRGISGDDSEGVVQRLDSIINTSATQAFIMLGINDLYDEKEVGEVMENYRKIITELLRKNIKVVIQSTLYVSREDARLRLKIAALNAQLKALEDTDKRITFIDLNSFLSHSGNIKSEFTTDGIHLNQNGYMVWACYLLQQGLVAMPVVAGKTILPAYCAGDR